LLLILGQYNDLFGGKVSSYCIHRESVEQMHPVTRCFAGNIRYWPAYLSLLFTEFIAYLLFLCLTDLTVADVCRRHLSASSVTLLAGGLPAGGLPGAWVVGAPAANTPRRASTITSC